MAEPSRKSEPVENVLRNILQADRCETIQEDKCVPSPIGCGGPAVEFRSAADRREYNISGLCQDCQDKIFGV